MEKNTIIKSGLTCFVRARAELMKSWLADDCAGRMLLDRIRTMTLEPMSFAGGEARPLSGKNYSFPGFSVSVQVLDDEFLEAAFDKLAARYREDAVWERMPYVQKLCLEPAFEMDHKTIHVDCTGFLVYAVVKNDRCLGELRDYMEQNRASCYEAYACSSYADTPFLQWFPAPRVDDACLCLGLLERIRQGDKDALAAYTRIAAEGYKKMRNQLKRCPAVSGDLLRILSEEEDVCLRLSILALGLAMAQDMGIPIQEDYTFYSILSAMVCYEEEMFESLEEAAATEQGKRRQRELEEIYNCYDFHQCYMESIYHNPPPDLSLEDHSFRHDSDYERLFSIFQVNPRIFHGIRLSREEVQKLCSTEEDMAWEDYEPMLLMATLCKYISAISKEYRRDEGSKAWNEVKRLREEILNIRKLLSASREQLSKIAGEKAKMEAEMDECRLEACRKREQLDSARTRQETLKKELEELRRFVASTLEKAESVQTESLRPESLRAESPQTESPSGRPAKNSRSPLSPDRRQSLKALYSQQVVVVGGHENWQRRVRARFPHWQYLPADKNHFDSRAIQNKKIIIVNTLVLKHSCYYRLMAQRRPEQTVLYVNENNMDRFLDQLGRQLGAMAAEG